MGFGMVQSSAMVRLWMCCLNLLLPTIAFSHPPHNAHSPLVFWEAVLVSCSIRQTLMATQHLQPLITSTTSEIKGHGCLVECATSRHVPSPRGARISAWTSTLRLRASSIMSNSSAFCLYQLPTL